MSNELETYDLIDQYLKGELSPESAHAVEDKIRIDDTFAAEVAEQRMLNTVIEGASIAGLREQMQADINVIDSKKGNDNTKYYLGGGLLALLTLGIIFWPTSSQNNTNEVASGSTIEEKIQKSSQHTTTNKQNEAVTTASESGNETVVKEEKETAVPSAPTVSAPTLSEIVVVPEDTNSLHETVQQHEEAKASNTPTTVEDICKKTTLDVTTQVKEACSLFNDGQIIIEKINGGEAPYAVYDKNSSAIIKNNTYSDLKSGVYELYIIDANSCIHEKNIVVPSKNCSGESIVINLTAQQGWKIEEKEAKVVVLDAAGRIVYEKPANVRIKEWMGIDKNGQLLPSGVYIYKIEYPDNKIVTGQINIMQ